MAFAQNLEKCFHILTQGQTYTEEELCIKLEDALLLCNKFSLVNREIVILHNPDKKEAEFQLKRNWNTDCPLLRTVYFLISPVSGETRTQNRPLVPLTTFYDCHCYLLLFYKKCIFKS